MQVELELSGNRLTQYRIIEAHLKEHMNEHSELKEELEFDLYEQIQSGDLPCAVVIELAIGIAARFLNDLQEIKHEKLEKRFLKRNKPTSKGGW